jgi:DNA-binding beta-propeller fold protein YncE
MLNTWKRSLVIAATLPGLLLAGLVVAKASDDQPAALPTEQGKYYRSPFARLTSEVWRYRSTFKANDLTPVVNNVPNSVAQPRRDKPGRVALNADASKLYVTLQGTENDPGNRLAVVDTASRKLIKHIQVGSRPYTAVLHPGGRFLVVTNEFSNYASVIDTRSDEVVNTIALDYYAQDIEFSDDGKTAWVAIRYLDQVLVVDLQPGNETLSGKVRVLGGFDDQAFYGNAALSAATRNDLHLRGYSEAMIRQAEDKSSGGINAILRARCASCHNSYAGGLLTGPDPVQNFLSAVENVIAGQPYASPLLRAVLPISLGGFGDQHLTSEFHPGGVLFNEGEPELQQLVDWITQANGGPGIAVGNEQAHPKDLARYGRYLLVGNTGTMDIAIIDTETNRLIGGIYTGNVTSHLLVKDDTLIVLTMGAGFGATKERDPHGGESWDRNNPATQYTVLRDPEQGYDALPVEQQAAMGPFDAVDGTWNFKMRDIQNDIIAIDLATIDFEQLARRPAVDYVLRTNKYEAHAAWVRYSSDTAEATTGDVKGDIPPELQRVPGAFPEWATLMGDRLYVTMAGSFELVEWQINAHPEEPSERLVPLRSYATGLLPLGVAAGNNRLYVANRMAETLSVIVPKTGAIETVVVGDLSVPALATDAERGDLVVHSAVFSSDGDVSCAHCHYRDTGDGRGWGAAEVVGQNRRGHLTPGGTLGIPQIKNIHAIQPYYFEGTHLLAEGQGADINEPASSIDFDRPLWSGDYRQLTSPVPEGQRRLMHEELKERVEVNKLGSKWYDLEYRRNAFFRDQSRRYFGNPYDLAGFYSFVGAWMGNENRLLPSPFDQQHPSVKRGEQLFNSAQVMCSVCHTAPEFTNKSRVLANNERRALPQLTTLTRRDASYSLASVFAMETANGDPLGIKHEDKGRFEEKEGSFTTMTLRGIFDRPPVFLHHGRARSLREVVLTPNHPGARRYLFPVLMGDEEVRPERRERGFNELTARTARGGLNPDNRIIDSHGGTSHLSPRQVNDLVNFMRVID